MWFVSSKLTRANWVRQSGTLYTTDYILHTQSATELDDLKQPWELFFPNSTDLLPNRQCACRHVRTSSPILEPFSRACFAPRNCSFIGRYVIFFFTIPMLMWNRWNSNVGHSSRPVSFSSYFKTVQPNDESRIDGWMCKFVQSYMTALPLKQPPLIWWNCDE